MGRTTGFDAVMRALRLARVCEDLGISTQEGLERAAASQAARREATATRRDLLRGAGAAAAVGLVAPRWAVAAPRQSGSVGIVGAGMAGLACADTLAASGIAATIYEGRERLGGRVWSMGGAFAGPVMFPGQVVERGGELIDTTHITMKNYAKQFKLPLEDVTKAWLPGETTYFFRGQHVSETVVVDEFRALVDRLRPVMSTLSNYVAFDSHTAYDEDIDYTTLADLLDDVGCPPTARDAIDTIYTIEYGAEIDRQSALNFLFFIHIDKRSHFQPFGVFSDERFHVIDGNEQIPQRLAARLPGPIELGMRLIAARRLSDGRVQLTFDDAGTTVTKVHDAVVFATPYSTLSQVALHSSLEIPAWQRDAIANFQYGMNAKLNVGFTRRMWGDHHSKGDSYSDLPNHQATWEPNPSRVSPGNAVMLDYSGGARAAALDPNKTDAEAKAFLTDLDKVWPGALAAAKRTGNNKFVAHLEHWPSDPFSKGSYTANAPGYFTTLEGRVGAPAGNVAFAGEHTDSFYEWQGFMEGAANSGIRAAGDVLAVL